MISIVPIKAERQIAKIIIFVKIIWQINYLYASGIEAKKRERERERERWESKICPFSFLRVFG